MAKITYQLIQKPIEERLIDAACIYWNVERSYFSQTDCEDQSTIVYRKSVIYYLMKENTTYSYKQLASKFGFISHMPVMRSIETIGAQKNIYKQTSSDLNQIQHLANILDADFVTKDIVLENLKLKMG